QQCITWRREPLAPLIPEIALWRSEITEVSGDLEPPRADNDQLIVTRPSALPQQLLDRPLRLIIGTFAEMVKPNASIHIGEIHGGPVLVVESPPDRIFAVDRDGYFTSISFAAHRTLSMSFSNGNSGVCTPTTSKP